MKPDFPTLLKETENLNDPKEWFRAFHERAKGLEGYDQIELHALYVIKQKTTVSVAEKSRHRVVDPDDAVAESVACPKLPTPGGGNVA